MTTTHILLMMHKTKQKVLAEFNSLCFFFKEQLLSDQTFKHCPAKTVNKTLSSKGDPFQSISSTSKSFKIYCDTCKSQEVLMLFDSQYCWLMHRYIVLQSSYLARLLVKIDIKVHIQSHTSGLRLSDKRSRAAFHCQDFSQTPTAEPRNEAV